MYPSLLKFLIFIHFGWHLIAAIGIAAGLVHSHNVHKRNPWKIALAVFWVAISIGLLFVADDACR